MEEEARVEVSLENRFKEALRKAKEVREDIRDYEGEPSIAECLAYDMQYVEKYVNQLLKENENLKQAIKINHDLYETKCNENKELEIQRDYYKERYLEFNNAFLQGGKELTKK